MKLRELFEKDERIGDLENFMLVDVRKGVSAVQGLETPEEVALGMSAIFEGIVKSGGTTTKEEIDELMMSIYTMLELSAKTRKYMLDGMTKEEALRKVGEEALKELFDAVFENKEGEQE